VIVRDITVRRQMEAALQESEEKYRRIVETANEGIWAIDSNCQTTIINRHMAEMLGCTPEEMIGVTPDPFVFEEDRGDYRARMAALREGESIFFEWRFRCKDGRELWTIVSGTLLKDVEGQSAGAFGMFTDITDRKRTEKILEARLRLSEAAGTLPLDELLQMALDEAEALTGSQIGFFHFVGEDQTTLSPQTWSTNTLRRMCTAEGLGRHYGVDEAGVWADCIRERRPVIHNDYASLGHRKELPAGHAPVLRELVVPILRHNRIVAVLGVGNKARDYGEKDVEAVASLANLTWDIVLRRKVEQELRRSEMKLRDLYREMQNSREEERCRIAREIHDEMGQNLTALKMDLAWLRRRIDPDQADLHQKLEAMDKLADDTLQIGRRVSSELRPGVLDALGLAAAVEWLVKDFEKRTEIPCELIIEPEEIVAGQRLSTDVFRILQEALTNVARHARASWVQVTLRQTPAEIGLHVTDNGVGISDELATPTTSLGLLGIRERLSAWAGSIRITGQPGKGTSLHVTIPLQEGVG
jgi:PAS domain S-box-containing protein